MLQIHRPPADLAEWIDGAVAIQLQPGLAASHFPAMPHAMLTLQRAAPAGPCSPVRFHTLSTRPTVHVHAGDVQALGLLLRPAAAASLLAASTGALVDQVLDWQVLAGSAEAARLDDEVNAAPTDAACLLALLASFRRTVDRLRQDAGPPPEHRALCELIGAHGALAGPRLGIGPRQLERRSQALLGLSPKRFQRLTRLHRVLSTAMQKPCCPPSDLALEGGFYDQSHLARDLRQLAGEPLASLLSAARDDGRWWPLASRRALLGGGGALPSATGRR